MSSYGRNFEFRVPPVHGQRGGRYAVPSTGSELPIGVPVQLDTTADETALGLPVLELAAEDTARAEGSGQGILVYEHGPAAFAGDDPWLTTYSDKDTVPVGAAVQLVRGPGIKIVLRNTETETFLNTREYTGRKMVAGLAGSTPTIAVGDYLLPGVGDDTDGYWKETATAAEAWLRVTKVDNDRAELEAEVLV